MNTKIKLKESDLVNYLINYLSEKEYIVKNEVPNLGQSVDIVAKKGKWLTFIEVKLFNWRKAIIQCRAHELIADYIYIAISTKKISKEFHQIATSRGYGIIKIDAYSKDIDIILKANMNKKYWKPQRDIFYNKFKEIEYAH